MFGDDTHCATSTSFQQELMEIIYKRKAFSSIASTRIMFVCKLTGETYNPLMTQKMTLDELGEMMTHVVKHMATKEDIETLDGKIDKLDTKVDKLQIQVNSMEQQLRMTRADIRLADLEEEVFGKVRV